VTDRSGSRGGNVRDLDTARCLQGEHKGDWTLIVREHIARTLIETGYFHADDVDELGVPAEHCNLIGSQIASYANRKLMEPTGVTRKVAHRAANGRRAPIYCITEKGRKELAGVRIGGQLAAERPQPTPSPDSGENSPEHPPPPACSGEPARLFEPKPMSAFTHPEAA
jgi:hypothetical protein